MTDKRTCDCGWQGNWGDLLSAPSPFDADEMIFACPKCKAIDKTHAVCDEPDCWEPATCGTPTADGHRTTCGGHIPTNIGGGDA